MLYLTCSLYPEIPEFATDISQRPALSVSMPIDRSPHIPRQCFIPSVHPQHRPRRDQQHPPGKPPLPLPVYDPISHADTSRTSYARTHKSCPIPLDNAGIIHYNGLAIGVWRSLVSRLVRVQEAAGSNPATPTKRNDSIRQEAVVSFVLFSFHSSLFSLL